MVSLLLKKLKKSLILFVILNTGLSEESTCIIEGLSLSLTRCYGQNLMKILIESE